MENNNEEMQKEIHDFMDNLSHKYFISTWVYAVAICVDDGSEITAEFSGSLPEARGLCLEIEDHLRDISINGKD